MAGQSYPTDEERIAELDRSLTNQSPTTEQIERIEGLREMAKDLGHQILDTVPNTATRTIAIRKLEECVMWAVKAIVLET